MVEIERLLLDMGARPSRRGYAQAAEILKVLCSQLDVEFLMPVYEEVSRKMNVSPQQIDRNVRAMIQEMWTTGNKGLLLTLMPWSHPQYPPSNKEFLCSVAARLRSGNWTIEAPWQPQTPRSGGSKR